MDDSEYDEYEAIVRVPRGARFTRSRKTAGAHRGMTRDPDTHQVGQAEIFLKKENGPDPVAAYPHGWLDSDPHESEARAQERREDAEFLAEVLVHIGRKVAEKAAPHVRKWWHEQALPAAKAKWNGQALPSMKAKWSSVARSRTSDRRAEAAEELQEVVTVSGDQQMTMSGAEARKRLAAAVMARIFSDEQLRLVRNARVVNEGSALSSMPQLWVMSARWCAICCSRTCVSTRHACWTRRCADGRSRMSSPSWRCSRWTAGVTRPTAWSATRPPIAAPGTCSACSAVWKACPRRRATSV
ncbi:hypothetical protein AB0E04_45990 [Streptomyces sp. NPDC048251]|uniref:hypothetical protein n=1 Tax=Streptomyces sp. NPDC048251 TaxID=3154501 RepID=UPI00343D92B5